MAFPNKWALPLLQWNRLVSKIIVTECSAFTQKYYTRQYSTNDSLIRAATLKGPKSSLSIEMKERTKKLKKGKVRIGVHCCAVNASDLLICQGLSDIKKEFPIVPGFELSGEILEVTNEEGDHSDDDDNDVQFKVGDKVLALSKADLHGFSQECIVDCRDVFHISDGLSYKLAAALPDSYSTAMLAFSRQARIKEKDIVLITAAAGGLGLAAVDLASNVYKAKVIGVCSTEDRATLVRDKGAFSAFSYKSEKGLRDKIYDVSKGDGAKVIFDAVGGELFATAMKCVSLEGKVVVAGLTSRDVSEIFMKDLLELPSFSLIVVSLSKYREHAPEIYRDVVNDVIELFEQGLISPHISEEFDLKDVNEALSHLKNNQTTGKVILNIPESE